MALGCTQVIHPVRTTAAAIKANARVARYLQERPVKLVGH